MAVHADSTTPRPFDHNALTVHIARTTNALDVAITAREAITDGVNCLAAIKCLS